MFSSILFVHQGYDLYGSDRTLIQSVQAVRSEWPGTRITVLLPQDGPLRNELLLITEDVRIADLAILRKCDLKRLGLGWLRDLVGKIGAARRMMQSYDVTYINTVMVMDYAIAAGLLRGAHVLHVHEIPTRAAALFFSGLLAFSRTHLVFNSHATQRRFIVPFWQRNTVVWNGIESPHPMPQRSVHARLHLLLIGRFNAWKGQGILLRAIARLPGELRDRIRVKLLGSVFGGQRHFADQIAELVETLSLTGVVEMLPFTPDPGPHYLWADLVAVPSTRPEPFGLVAIEGMAAGCAVLAADHGGIAEIVLDGVTGSLVRPNSVEELSAAIGAYILNPERARVEGEAGRKRFLEHFEEGRYKAGVVNIVAGLSESRSRAAP